MTVRLGTNIASLQAQRRLGEAAERMGATFARLASGQRIVRPADDATGRGLADSLSVKSRVFEQGLANLNNGISALGVAESAVDELTRIVSRIQELAEQGANGSYSPSQRVALDKEAQLLRDEFLRVARGTAFNGRRLFDGSVQGLAIQAGFGSSGAVVSSLGGDIGSGQFGAGNDALVTFGGGLRAADLNGDGKVDLTKVSGSDILLSLGNGDGTFGSERTLLTSGTLVDTHLSDFNRDGVLDIAGILSGGSISVFLGNGNGTFRAAISSVVGGSPQAVAGGDFNGDGIQDLATVNSPGNTAAVLLGNGDGSFRVAQSVAVGTTPLGLSTGDFNGDGKVDLVSANAAASSVSVLLGNGNGTFGAATTLALGVSSQNVHATDLNRDGFSDILALRGDSSIATLMSNGNGTFRAMTTYSVGGAANDLTLDDLNGDGMIDVATADYDDATVSVILGNGDGSFGARTTRTTGGFPTAIVSADFTNDGVLDLAAYNGEDGVLNIHAAVTRDGINPILPFSLRTQADSRQALTMLGRKLELLTLQRGEIGAFQSRLMTAAQTLLVQREEFTAADSRIRDADVGAEAAELVRTRILQQSAAAIMGQANQQPQVALRLLSGL